MKKSKQKITKEKQSLNLMSVDSVLWFVSAIATLVCLFLIVNQWEEISGYFFNTMDKGKVFDEVALVRLGVMAVGVIITMSALVVYRLKSIKQDEKTKYFIFALFITSVLNIVWFAGFLALFVLLKKNSFSLYLSDFYLINICIEGWFIYITQESTHSFLKEGKSFPMFFMMKKVFAKGSMFLIPLVVAVVALLILAKFHVGVLVGGVVVTLFLGIYSGSILFTQLLKFFFKKE